MSPDEIIKLAEAVDRLNRTVSSSHWILWFIVIGGILIFILDRLYFFNKIKEISEEKNKLLEERCKSEKETMRAQFEAEKTKLIIDHSKDLIHSSTLGLELSKDLVSLEKLATKGPQNTEKLFHRLVAAGMQYENIHRHDLSADCFEDALTIRPNDIGLHLQLGIVYGEKIGDSESKEKAIKHCKDVLRIDSNNVSAKFNLAVYTNHTKGPKESLPIYLEAEKLIKAQGLTGTELDGKLNLFVGHDYKSNDDYKEAKKRYENSIAILRKLAQQGDKTSSFWLENAERNLKDLLKDFDKEK